MTETMMKEMMKEAMKEMMKEMMKDFSFEDIMKEMMKETVNTDSAADTVSEKKTTKKTTSAKKKTTKKTTKEYHFSDHEIEEFAIVPVKVDGTKTAYILDAVETRDGYRTRIGKTLRKAINRDLKANGGVLETVLLNDKAFKAYTFCTPEQACSVAGKLKTVYTADDLEKVMATM